MRNPEGGVQVHHNGNSIDQDKSSQAFWYVVRTQPRRERLAIISLQPVAYDTYLPLIKTKAHRPKANGVDRMECLFPGYIFCKTNLTTNGIRNIQYAHGVRYILGYENKPTPLEEEIVAEMRSRVDLLNSSEIASQYYPGQRVKIVRGPLNGLEGAITVTLPGRERVRILLGFMERRVECTISAYSISPS